MGLHHSLIPCVQLTTAQIVTPMTNIAITNTIQYYTISICYIFVYRAISITGVLDMWTHGNEFTC